MVQSYPGSATCKHKAHVSVLPFSKGLWTALIPPHPHIHISSGNKTTPQARGTLQSYSKCATDSSLIAVLYSWCCSTGQLKQLQGADWGCFCHMILEVKFSRYITALGANSQFEK